MNYILAGIVVAVVLFLVYGYCLNFFLKTEYYGIHAEKVDGEVRLVLLTDLHGNRYGKDNQKLVGRIEREHPDLICITGDMTVKDGKGIPEVLSLLQRLAEQYPVYYSPGNHEIRMPDYENYKRQVREFGVYYLENEWLSAGHGIVLGGLDLPEYWYHKCWERRKLDVPGLAKIMEPPGRAGSGGTRASGGETLFPVLLAHNPEYFPQYADWGAGLVLSGHLHGGIARLPFLGGVIAPSLRLFPAYDAGYFHRGESHMVVSRGLGLHHIRFRFFNRPELSVIDIYGKNR